MKSVQVLTFTTNADAAASSRPFALEQKEWPEKSPANFSAWLAANNHTNPSVSQIIWLYEQYKSSCNGSGGLVATLRVRLLDLATPYVLRASYGAIGAPVLVTETRQEFLAFELGTEKSVDFGTITAATWNGDVWDAAGNKLAAAPVLTLSGRTVTAPQPVYGVLECTVVESLYEHTLALSPRTMTPAQAARFDDGENIIDELYASTAMLFCNQQIDLVNIDTPQNFGTCSGGYSTGGSGSDDDDDEDQAPRWYQVGFEVLDYCTGAPIQNATIYVDGQLIVSQGEWVAPGYIWPEGTHTIEVSAPGYLSSREDRLPGNESFALGTGSNG